MFFLTQTLETNFSPLVRLRFLSHFVYLSIVILLGNGNPLQWSCLENPRDGGAWWASVYEVAQSRTQLKLLSSSSLPIKKQYNYLRNLHKGNTIPLLPQYISFVCF